MEPLNTMVDGVPAQCRDLAAWFTAFAGSSNNAATSVQQSRNSAGAGWHGPAGEMFVRQAYSPLLLIDDLTETCRAYATGLTEFAGSLEAVKNSMTEVLAKARGGGLSVIDDIFIYPPKPDHLEGPQPHLPPGPSEAEVHKYNEMVAGYNAKVDAYNAKVAVFNECSTLVEEAKVKEDQAHADLAASLAPKEGAPGMAEWQVAGESAQTLLSSAEAYGNARGAALADIGRIDGEGNAFTKLASATEAIPFTEQEKALFRAAAGESGADANRQLRYLDLLQRGVPAAFNPARIPPGVAKPSIGGGAGRAAIRDAKPVVRAIPLLGDLLIAGDEVAKVFSREQTIPVAAIRTVGLISAGNVGSAVGVFYGLGYGAAEYGPLGGVVGAVVGPVVGDYMFSKGADEGLDALLKQVMPDDINPDLNQPRVEKVDHIAYR